MIYFRIILIGCLLMAFSPATARAGEAGIAAVVNQDAISMSDLNERMKLIMASSGLPNNPDIRAKLTKQVIESLIEEQLMLQEAKRREITVTQAEIDQGFAQLAAQNKIPADKFAAMIAHSGVDISTMHRQIRAQLGWSKIIQKVMRPQVTVADADVDEYIARIAANKGKTENLVAEIFLPVDTPEQDSDVRQLAMKLVSEMRAGKAPFFKVAQQFSKAPGAPQGGNLGWMQQGQLPEELDAALATMKPQEISEAIRAATGYHILMLREQRQISDASIPSRDEVTSTIGIQRLERMQRRTLMDLKSAAFIENRVQS